MDYKKLSDDLAKLLDARGMIICFSFFLVPSFPACPFACCLLHVGWLHSCRGFLFDRLFIHCMYKFLVIHQFLGVQSLVFVCHSCLPT